MILYDTIYYLGICSQDIHWTVRSIWVFLGSWKTTESSLLPRFQSSPLQSQGMGRGVADHVPEGKINKWSLHKKSKTLGNCPRLLLHVFFETLSLTELLVANP